MPIKNALKPGKFIVYGLCDPETKELRYIGFTVDTLTKRLNRHMNSKEKNHRTNWLNSIVRGGKKPEIFKIAETDLENYQEDEIFYIEYFKSIGCNLVNATKGGEGWLGMKHRDKAKDKDSLAHRKLNDKEVRDIFEKYKEGFYTQEELAEEYKVKRATILRIINRNNKYRYIKQNKYLQDAHIDKSNRPTGKKKLTKQDVLSIREKIGEGFSNKDLAKPYAIDPATISNIRCGKYYKSYV